MQTELTGVGNEIAAVLVQVVKPVFVGVFKLLDLLTPDEDVDHYDYTSYNCKK